MSNLVVQNTTNESPSAAGKANANFNVTQAVCPPKTNETQLNITGPCPNSTGNFSSTSAHGVFGPADLIIKSNPWTVKSCDQVLMLEGKTITNYDDCDSKVDSFFTMSMYYVNRLNSTNPASLMQSILVENIKEMPFLVPGFKKSCVLFKDSKHINNDISICVQSQQQAQSLLDAFSSFFKCRTGDNLKPLTLREIQMIMNARCNGKPISPLAAKGFTNLQQEEMKRQALREQWKGKINPFYGNLRVPGSKLKDPLIEKLRAKLIKDMNKPLDEY